MGVFSLSSLYTSLYTSDYTDEQVGGAGAAGDGHGTARAAAFRAEEGGLIERGGGGERGRERLRSKRTE